MVAAAKAAKAATGVRIQLPHGKLQVNVQIPTSLNFFFLLVLVNGLSAHPVFSVDPNV